MGYIGALCGRDRAFLGAPGEGKDEGLLRRRIINGESDSSQSESDPEPGSDSQDTLQEQRAEQALQSLHDRVIYHSRLVVPLNGAVRFHDEVFYSIHARVSQLQRPSVNELRCLDLLIVDEEPKFYVGGTQNPIRRWQGDPDPRNGRGPMPGHCLKWQEMHVVAARLGPAGPSVETALISYSMQKYDKRCVNKKADSRGLSGKDYVLNFIYVCIRARDKNILHPSFILSHPPILLHLNKSLITRDSPFLHPPRVGPNMPPRLPKLAPRRPTIASRRPKTHPRDLQEDLQWTPRRQNN